MQVNMQQFFWFLRTRSFEVYKPLCGFALAAGAFAIASSIAWFGLRSQGLAATLLSATALCAWWTLGEAHHLWLDYKEEREDAQ